MDFFKQDRVLSGFLATLLTIGITLFLIFTTIRFLKGDLLVNMKASLFAFVGAILLVRYYAKQEKYLSFKGALLCLFACMITCIIVLIKYNYISLT